MPAWPNGIMTATIIFGAGFSPFGNPTSSRLVVTPVYTGTKSVVWAATSTPMLPFAETASSAAGATGVATVPVVDQDGWLDDGQHGYKLWGYRLDETNTYGTAKGPTRTKYCQPLTGQSTIYFDDIPDGSLGLAAVGPVAAVTSVNGQVGAVTVAGASDTDIAALVDDPQSATAASLAATYSPLVPYRQVPPFASITLPVMATPPTVTANVSATTISGTTVDWPITLPTEGSEVAGPILAYGIVDWDNTDPNYLNALHSVSPYDDGASFYEWVTDAPIVELVYCGTGASDFRLEIDGQLAQATDYTFTSPGGGNRRIVINSGSRAVRQFRFTSHLGVPAIKLTTSIVDTVYAPAGGKRLRSFWLMDSYGQVGAQDSLEYVASGMLDIGNVLRSAVGGTGYTHANGSYPPFTDSGRLAVATRSKADLVVVAGGINDQDTTGLAAACDTVYASLRASLPNAQLVVVGPWMPSTSTQTSKAAIRDVISARAAAAGLPFIDVTGWITGSGNTGAPNGTGNADVMIDPDGTHPIGVGHQYLGARLAGEIAKVWRQPGTPANR